MRGSVTMSTAAAISEVRAGSLRRTRSRMRLFWIARDQSRATLATTSQRVDSSAPMASSPPYRCRRPSTGLGRGFRLRDHNHLVGVARSTAVLARAGVRRRSFFSSAFSSLVKSRPTSSRSAPPISPVIAAASSARICRSWSWRSSAVSDCLSAGTSGSRRRWTVGAQVAAMAENRSNAASTRRRTGPAPTGPTAPGRRRYGCSTTAGDTATSAKGDCLLRAFGLACTARPWSEFGKRKHNAKSPIMRRRPPVAPDVRSRVRVRDNTSFG